MNPEKSPRISIEEAEKRRLFMESMSTKMRSLLAQNLSLEKISAELKNELDRIQETQPQELRVTEVLQQVDEAEVQRQKDRASMIEVGSRIVKDLLVRAEGDLADAEKDIVHSQLRMVLAYIQQGITLDELGVTEDQLQQVEDKVL